MDTKIFIVFPLHILQFIIGDDVVSSEDRGRLSISVEEEDERELAIRRLAWHLCII